MLASSSGRSALPGIGDAFQGSKVATGVSKFAPRGDDVAGTVKKFGKGSKAKAVGRGAARSSGPVFKRDGEAWKSLEELMKKMIKSITGR